MEGDLLDDVERKGAVLRENNWSILGERSEKTKGAAEAERMLET